MRGDFTTPPPQKACINQYYFQQWEKRWELYKRHISDPSGRPAQRSPLTKKILRLRHGLHKAESSLVTHIKAECIGLQAYLYSRKVPGAESPDCGYGQGRQTAKHILVFCPQWNMLRQRVFEATNVHDYHRVVETPSGLRKSARVLMDTGLLGHFSLAKTLLYDEV